MSRPKWQAKLINRFFGKIFFLARITRVPVVGTLIFKFLFKKDDITFIPVNESIRRHEHVALPSDIVRHFIMISKYIWIKHECVCRAAEGCKNYPVDLGCIYMGDAVNNFNPDLGRMVTVDEALDHLRRCDDAGLVHMIGLNRMDSLMLNCAPSDALMTICNCCECCCFFRILPGLNDPIKEKIKGLPNVNVCVLDTCTGCGECVSGCFVKAISIEGGKACINENCIGCGKCVMACGTESIRLDINDPVFINNSIARISDNQSRPGEAD
jgi:ferredoxin